MIPLSETEAMVPSPEVSPEQAAERAWERREIHTALPALPADATRVIVLRYFAELSLAEVAAVLELPSGTVKLRLHRAPEKLRLELVGGAAQGARGVHEETEVER